MPALVTLGVVFSARTAAAAGTALDIQSGRGTGMAAAVTAMIDDSSAIFYNPAGIAQGRILDAQVGDTLVMPSFKFTDQQGQSTSTLFKVSAPFQVYESGGITDHLSIGVGVFTPFGLTVPWPSEWEGKSIVTEAALATYDFNPTVAYRLGPVRIGVGVQLVRATVDLKRKIDTPSEVSAELGADTWGEGFNVGAQLEAIARYLSLGVAYRSAVTLDFTGNVHFDGVPPPFQATLHDQLVKTSLTNPDVFQMGVASRPLESLVIDVDLVWYGWSKFHAIDIKYPNDASGTLSVPEPKNWNNTVNVHLGGEVAVNDTWRLRAGAMYDPSPSPSNTLLPDVPDANRVNVAVGVGYAHPSGFSLDVGYQLLVLFSKTSTATPLAGTYSGLGNIIGISVGYRTPKKPAL
ncbi:MAG TPA: outer membrane protein transport protein [Acidimicrobiales bacterium]|nr:outer membrane protein transport protein [Acidimicrobiales bacterium]